MKITTTEVNVATGEVTVKEVELSEEQVAEMEKQQRISEIQNRMSEIVSELNSTDWKTIKFIEGELSEDDFNSHKQTRSDLRLEYNTLETELSDLTKE